MVELPAAPTALTLDTAKTAVIVVDMQNDFGSRGGMFDRAGIGWTSSSERFEAALA